MWAVKYDIIREAQQTDVGQENKKYQQQGNKNQALTSFYKKNSILSKWSATTAEINTYLAVEILKVACILEKSKREEFKCILFS